MMGANRECEQCGGWLNHPANGDWTCDKCKRGIRGVVRGGYLLTSGEVVRDLPELLPTNRDKWQ
jgi:ribosomal protein L37AE/L43A